MTQQTSKGTDGVSRRKFIIGAGAAGVAGLAGCTSDEGSGDNNADGNGGSGNGGGGSGGNGSEGGNGGGNLSGNIEIAGSSTVYPLATAVSEQFRQEHSDVEINLRSTGSGGGFQNFFCPGQTDFNNASRPIKDEEKQLCSDNDISPVELKVATDALTVVVNPDNDFVDCVTVEELRQLWSADGASQWSDVRSEWPDEQIERYGAAETSGTFDYFNEAIIGEENDHTQEYQATEDDNTIVQGVTGSQYAIGYFGFAYYSSNQDAVKALGIDNGNGCVQPTLENAKSGNYAPLSRPLFTYAATESLSEEHVAEFARYYVEQTTNQDLVSGTVGYVPNTDEEKQEMMNRLESAIEKAQSN